MAKKRKLNFKKTLLAQSTKQAKVNSASNPLAVFPVELWEMILDSYRHTRDIGRFLSAFPEFEVQFNVKHSLVPFHLVFPNPCTVAQVNPVRLTLKHWNDVIERFAQYKGLQNGKIPVAILTNEDIYRLCSIGQPTFDERVFMIEKTVKDCFIYDPDERMEAEHQTEEFFHLLHQFLENKSQNITQVEMRFTVHFYKAEKILNAISWVLKCLTVLKQLRVLVFQLDIYVMHSDRTTVVAYERCNHFIRNCFEFPAPPQIESLTILESDHLAASLVQYFARNNLHTKQLKLHTYGLRQSDYVTLQNNFPKLCELEADLCLRDINLAQIPYFFEPLAISKLVISNFYWEPRLYATATIKSLFDKISSLNVKHLTLENCLVGRKIVSNHNDTDILEQVPSIEYFSVYDHVELGFDFLSCLTNLKRLVVHSNIKLKHVTKSEVVDNYGLTTHLLRNMFYNLNIPVPTGETIWNQIPTLEWIEFDNRRLKNITFVSRKAGNFDGLAY